MTRHVKTEKCINRAGQVPSALLGSLSGPQSSSSGSQSSSLMVGQLERRHAPRAEFSGITMVRAGTREIWCKAANVSEGGILLYPQGRASLPSDPLRVTFTLPSVSSWIELEGRVVRHGHLNRRTVWGVAFTEVPRETRHVLKQFVSSQVGGRHRSRPPPLPSIDVPRPLETTKARTGRATAPMRTHSRSSSSELSHVPTESLSSTGSARTPPSCRGSIPVVKLPLDESRPEPSTRRVPSAEVERIARMPEEEQPTRRTEPDETTGLRDSCRRRRRS